MMRCSKRSNWSFILAGCLALVVPVPGCGDNDDAHYSATIEQITDLIEQRMQENDVTGLSIALVDGQDAVWAKGFGYADKENGVKATAETIYEIGSVSKTITATAVMRLTEQGLLNIDQPLKAYLPEFSIQPPLRPGPTPAGQITIRTMLTHHSGIPGDLLNGAFALEPDPDHNKELLTYLQTDYATYSPNFVGAYSNIATSLLGEVVARVSGQSFEKNTDGLFEEMGMQHSSFYFNKPFLKENISRGYLREQMLEHLYVNIPGAGSGLSSVSEMSQFIKMVLADGQSVGGSVLRRETLAEMLTRQNKAVALDYDSHHGLSWFLGDPELQYAGRLCFHAGATIFFRSHLEILLDHQLGVVVLSNSGAAPVVQEIAQQTLKLALKEKTGIEPVEPSGPPYSAHTTLPQQELEDLAGIYVTGGGYDIVKAVPGALEWTAGTAPPQRLVALDNGRFASPDSQDFQIEFGEVSGRDVMIKHHTMTSLVGERYQPVPLSSAWRDRLGKYDISNLDPLDCSKSIPEELRVISLSIELVEKDGMLIIEYTIQATPLELVIEPLSDNLGVIRGLARSTGGAVQIVTVDGQEQIQLWGSRYKK